MESRHLVDPELLAGLDALPPMLFNLGTLPVVRGMIDQMAAGYTPPPDDGIGMVEYAVPGADGAPPVPVLLYTPDHGPEPLPVVIYIHGGGYFSGKAATFDPWARLLAREVGCAVASIDYRLSPETRYPGAIEDCYAALRWLHREHVNLRIDPARIAIEGVSAGGGLAAALSLMARDRGGPAIAFLSLIYPMLDDRTGREGVKRVGFTGEFGWPYQGNAFGWETLLGEAAGGADVPAYAAPARATDLSRLPPTFVGVGALDALMEEDVSYAVRLIDAGVPTELHVYPGAYHGFDAFDAGQSRVGGDFRTLRVEVLRRALAR